MHEAEITQWTFTQVYFPILIHKFEFGHLFTSLTYELWGDFLKDRGKKTVVIVLKWKYSSLIFKYNIQIKASFLYNHDLRYPALLVNTYLHGLWGWFINVSLCENTCRRFQAFFCLKVMNYGDERKKVQPFKDKAENLVPAAASHPSRPQ